ncbi:MAG: hypothetical protein AB7N80_14630 [Bdellovibrionales bacterium]
MSKSVRRVSLMWFMIWAVSVVSVIGLVRQQTNRPQMPMGEALVHEIENLEVIQRMNDGHGDADQVAVSGFEGPKSHRTPRRATLSQR